MATAKQLHDIAMGLDGTEHKPHFDRMSYKVARIYCTVPADGLTANLNLTPDQQMLKLETAPEAFAPVDNAWGAKGWTCMTLKPLTKAELANALELAWGNAQKTTRRKK